MIDNLTINGRKWKARLNDFTVDEHKLIFHVIGKIIKNISTDQ